MTMRSSSFKNKKKKGRERYPVHAPLKINRNKSSMESTNKWQIARRTTSLHNREVWQCNEHVTLSYRQICLRGVYDSFVILLLRKWSACIDRSPTEVCIRSIVNVSRQLPTGIPDILNRSLWWIAYDTRYWIEWKKRQKCKFKNDLWNIWEIFLEIVKK